jgi:hypothetical protein
MLIKHALYCTSMLQVLLLTDGAPECVTSRGGMAQSPAGAQLLQQAVPWLLACVYSL